MLTKSRTILPYEPQFTGHREAQKRRELTRIWLRLRERELAREQESPSIVPDHGEERTPRKSTTRKVA